MHHDHIGIPKFIQKGFSFKNKACCYDLNQDKKYWISIDRLGTENNYYDQDVETNLLANGVESQFSAFYNDFCGTTDTNLMIEILNKNIELVTQFFSFMFSRAKKTLDTVNQESITSQIFGNIDHSEFLRIQSIINTNPFEMIGKEYRFYPLINFSKVHFINNSLGFGIMVNKEKEISIVIPLNIRVSILVTNCKELKHEDLTYIEPEGDFKSTQINYCICKLEHSYGNGFIFSESEDLINDYIEYIKKLTQE